MWVVNGEHLTLDGVQVNLDHVRRIRLIQERSLERAFTFIRFEFATKDASGDAEFCDIEFTSIEDQEAAMASLNAFLNAQGQLINL